MVQRGPVVALPHPRVLEAQSRSNRTIIESIMQPERSTESPASVLRAQDPDALLAGLRTGRLARTAENYTFALRVLGAHRRFDAALALLQSMAAAGVRPTAATFDAAIAACAGHRNPTAGAAVLEAMRAAGVSPTAASYTSLMHAYARAGDVDGCIRVLQVGPWVGGVSPWGGVGGSPHSMCVPRPR
jgi:pentatricopeptide repeat protein